MKPKNKRGRESNLIKKSYMTKAIHGEALRRGDRDASRAGDGETFRGDLLLLLLKLRLSGDSLQI
jgi:hypothetical protein